MKILIHKTSDQEHDVRVERPDGSTHSKVLDSRSFLRHDLAHLAAEMCLGIDKGYWGLVAAGAALDDASLKGPDLMRAERFAGPVQTLMRTEADAGTFFEVLSRIEPDTVTRELAGRIQEKCRQLAGHWRATPCGGDMELVWDIFR